MFLFDASGKCRPISSRAQNTCVDDSFNIRINTYVDNDVYKFVYMYVRIKETQHLKLCSYQLGRSGRSSAQNKKELP